MKKWKLSIFNFLFFTQGEKWVFYNVTALIFYFALRKIKITKEKLTQFSYFNFLKKVKKWKLVTYSSDVNT